MLLTTTAWSARRAVVQRPTPALGQKRNYLGGRDMSAPRSEADIANPPRHVRKSARAGSSLTPSVHRLRFRGIDWRRQTGLRRYKNDPCRAYRIERRSKVSFRRVATFASLLVAL